MKKILFGIPFKCMWIDNTKFLNPYPTKEIYTTATAIFAHHTRIPLEYLLWQIKNYKLVYRYYWLH